MMLLDNGREVVCPDHVLFHQPQRLQIHPGDRVAKARGSLTFTINGRNVTDFGWFVRKWLFPTHLWVLLLVCLSANAVAWLRQAHPRRTPARIARVYSGTAMPDPPSSAGKSFSLGSPSFIGSTVSA